MIYIRIFVFTLQPSVLFICNIADSCDQAGNFSVNRTSKSTKDSLVNSSLVGSEVRLDKIHL